MFKKYEDYRFSQLENACECPDLDEGLHPEFTMDQFGHNTVGELFVVLRKIDTDHVISFVLTGATSNEYIFTCVYNDLQPVKPY